MTAINRRAFLGLMGAVGMVAAVPTSHAGENATIPGVYASASRGADGDYYLHVIGPTQMQLVHRLPTRAHQVLFHPQQPWVVAVARRPGTFIDIVDYHHGVLVQRIQLADKHYLYGHAQITADGRYILTTEKYPDVAEGQVVIRDLNNQGRIIQRYGTGGIGPHELRLNAAQDELIVANGGILTAGRDKLNLDSMQPSLAYLDLKHGQITEQVALEARYHQASIRHFDVSPQGDVLLAMQYQGHPADVVPLVAVHRKGEPLQTLTLPETVRAQLAQYCGSACFDISGRFGAVSAPRGNRVVFWDVQAHRYLGEVKTKDGCGLAATGTMGEFVVSTGRGHFYRVNAATQARQRLSLSDTAIWQWDNHMARFWG